ncbi:MAG: hypothetical protein KDB03_20615 [Planctomycetales bacterium]|nr:hypothetical protein [Planctomycetales bacterium]
MKLPKRQNYSALVEMRLILGASVLPFAQLGPSFGILRESINVAPTDAKIEVVIDRRVSSVYNVFLYEGISSKRFEFF